MGRTCEMCPEGKPKSATLFCAADECFLCSACDEVVHSANRLSRRHIRRPVSLDDTADGSSINDDSELGLVPDVAELSENNASDLGPSEETLLMSLPTPVPVSFEDAAEYDFCDFPEDGLEGKMPALCAIDEDELFADTKTLGKSMYVDMSWENVVPENIEHVVPDVSESTPGRPVSGTSCLKREAVEVEIKPKVVSANFLGSTNEESDETKEKARKVGVRTTSKAVIKTEDEVSKKEITSEPEREGRLTGKKRARDESEEVESSGSGMTTEEDAEKERMERTAEQRKKRRMEALARFRSKRANRSFTKKVRYECRKQLADSRPRVKGRFVRKIEMALYRKYGALYREHLDELKQPVGTKVEGEGSADDQ